MTNWTKPVSAAVSILIVSSQWRFRAFALRVSCSLA
jgi:hypothetical protein